jgi:hypothetical protein
MKYQIDPHLRHDFSNPPGPRHRWRRTRLWFRRQEHRLGQWLFRHLPPSNQPEVAALQLLVAGLTLIVLFQAGLLVLLRPQ